MSNCDLNLELASGKMQALGNCNRFRILCLLSEKEMNVSDLQKKLGLVQSGISHHLKILHRHGLVKCREQGLKSYYGLAGKEVIDMLKLAIELYGLNGKYRRTVNLSRPTAILDGRQLAF